MSVFELMVGAPIPGTEAECPCCRFDALVSMPVVRLSADGVSDLGELRTCLRCFAEKCSCLAP